MHRRHTGIPLPCRVGCTVAAAPPPDVPRRAYRSLGEGDNGQLGIGGLAGGGGPIVAQFSSNFWTHRSPPVVVTLPLQESVLTIEVSDAGAGLAVFAGPRPPGASGHGLPAAVDIAQQIGIDGEPGYQSVGAAELPSGTRPARARAGTAAA